MTYEEINVYLFCIIGPIVFLLMFIYILHLRGKVKRLKRVIIPAFPSEELSDAFSRPGKFRGLCETSVFAPLWLFFLLLCPNKIPVHINT